ncbi:sialin-like [Diadema antillarum]|uniref:sialin-like n=1 Tax=Diadema antillarum TaxID=105358 RepID=UPI003A895500
MARWSPPDERSRLLAIAFAGLPAGQIIAPPVSGLISQSQFLGGWPSTFYLFGTMGIVWFVIWTLTVYDTPMSHPRMSAAEREFIVSGRKDDQRSHKSVSYPWKSFATSMPVYAFCVGDFGIMWTVYMATTNLPLYLTEALRFSVSKVSPILFSSISGSSTSS